MQNQPINNIAGLGIANGERPFKKLARPMLFLPRSTIRVTVDERFGRGNLFIVFQGYKRLGGPTTNQPAVEEDQEMMPSAQRRFSSNISEATGSAPERRGIPFDYAFRYEFKESPGT